MIFKKVFVEKDILHSQRTQEILSRLKISSPHIIERINEHWGRVKKPYLHKRKSLNLFIGKKRGTLLKEAPPAYGTKDGIHYYFIHSYNCVYECQYCYLQGYFQTPDMVFFINHEDILQEIEALYLKHQRETPELPVWFHAGEFSDSLALSHITKEWGLYWEAFKNWPYARLELRTKSANIKEILNLPASPNRIITFSLASQEGSKKFDLRTPALAQRLKALKKLTSQGHYYGLHLDPIIYQENFEKAYQDLAKEIGKLPQNLLSYISLGVVRFTRDVYRQVENNYPQSPLLGENFIKSFDKKVRYSRPMRMWILQTVKNALINQGISSEKIYLCME